MPELTDLLDALGAGAPSDTPEDQDEPKNTGEDNDEGAEDKEQNQNVKGEDGDGDAGEEEGQAAAEGGSEEDEEEEEEPETSEDVAEEIRRSVMEMIAKAQQQQTPVLNNSTQQQQQPQPEPQDKQPSASIELNDDDIMEAMESPEKFKEVINRVYKKAVEDAMRSVIPSVNQIVSQQMAIKTAVDNFYRENEDLVPYKEFVGFVANVVASEHPEWDVPRVLEETAKISRQKLLLDKTATKKKKRVGGTPKPPTTRKPQPQLDALEKEILELISD